MTDTLRFGNVEVRPSARELLLDGAPVKLGARAFDVLLALVERRDCVVGKNELLELVWPGVVVEENNLQVQISTLRKLLGPQVIATIPGRGYRFAAAVDGDREAGASASRDLAHVAPAPPATSSAGNLPPAAPRLLGRDKDIDALAALVPAYRLVSIVGAGGIGKTRLALAAAHRLRSALADGVWLVDLAPLADAQLLPAAVAQALGAALAGGRSPLDEVTDLLRGRDLLLVLDNCEHVVDEASRFASAVLEQTTGVRLLTTSQELLRVEGEHLYRVAPLALPEGDDVASAQAAGAVALFVERAASLLPDFALGEHNVADVVDICRRLDGLPLAIELAAARVPLLGVAGVRERLHERFRMLTGGARTVLRRHQTLRELLDWSHGLLGEDDRVVFRRAGVFAGSFTLPAAQQTLADARVDEWAVLDHLGTLVDKSLVAVEPGEPPRYRMLESTRAYALEKLRESGETESVLRLHAQAVRALFEHERTEAWTVPAPERTRRCLPDIDNLRAALDWSREAGERELHVALAGASAWLWGAVGLRLEGLRRCDEALTMVDAATPPLLEARLQLERQMRATPRFDTDERKALQRAIDLFRQLGDQQELFAALGNLVAASALNGDLDVGAQALAEMEQLHDATWPPALRWQLVKARVWQWAYEGQADKAAAQIDEGRRLAEQAGDESLLMGTLIWAEQNAQTEGRTEEAVARGKQLLALLHDMPFSRLRSNAISNLCTALTELGRIDEALPLVRQAFELNSRAGTLWAFLDPLALLALRQGRDRDAARVLGRADAVHAWRRGRRELAEMRIRDLVERELGDRLSAADFEALRREGEMLTDEEAAQVALGEQQ